MVNSLAVDHLDDIVSTSISCVVYMLFDTFMSCALQMKLNIVYYKKNGHSIPESSFLPRFQFLLNYR